MFTLAACAEREPLFRPSTVTTADFWGFKTPPGVALARFDRDPPNPGGVQFACAAGVLNQQQLDDVVDLNLLDKTEPGSYSQFGYKNCVPNYRDLCDDPDAFSLYVNKELSVVSCDFGGAILVKVSIRTY